MAGTSQVHGMKEIISAKTAMSRLFWIGLCAICVIAAFVGIYRIVDKYQSDRIATKIAIVTENVMQYPTILYCPLLWINETKAKRTFEMTDDDIAYIYELRNIELKQYGWQSLVEARDHQTPPDRFQNLVDISRIHGLGQIAHLLEAIALNRNLTCECCDSVIRNKVTLAGLCHLIRLCKANFQTTDLPVISDHLQHTHITKLQPPGSCCRHKPDKPDGALWTIVNDKQTIGVHGYDMSLAKRGHSLRIKLAMHHIKRIPTAKTMCNVSSPGSVDKQTSPSYCEFLCINEYENIAKTNCSKLSIFEWLPVSMPQCYRHYVDTQESDLSAKCRRRCVPSCETDFVKVLSTDSSKYVTTLIQMHFFFASFTATDIIDVETISIDTLVSSIGGQTGLWLGASVVSICQLLSYCLCPCLHWPNFKDKYHSARQSIKRKARDSFLL